jgi:PIN domain nuclease of toxin-antitoxin system
MIVLDTHIWLWWIGVDDIPLKQSWRDAMEGAEERGVSAISCFEVAWLVHRERVEIPMPLDEWFDAALDGSRIRLLPLSPLVARIAAQLPMHHRDPHDRIIIATAIAHDARLLSADRRFGEYRELDERLVS